MCNSGCRYTGSLPCLQVPESFLMQPVSVHQRLQLTQNEKQGEFALTLQVLGFMHFILVKRKTDLFFFSICLLGSLRYFIFEQIFRQNMLIAVYKLPLLPLSLTVIFSFLPSVILPHNLG